MPNTETKVVNKRASEYEVYIGRGSIWGNPFPLSRNHTDADRARVIDQFEEYLLSQPQLLSRLPGLLGKRLGCFCAPKPCHGDVLKRYAEIQRGRGSQKRILITGSRDFTDAEAAQSSLRAVLQVLGSGPSNTTLIHGNARGADLLLKVEAERLSLKTEAHPAKWLQHDFEGSSSLVCPSRHVAGERCVMAGLRRNDLMIGLGADIVLAFPLHPQKLPTAASRQNTSRGTWHCAKSASDAGLPVFVATSGVLVPFPEAGRDSNRAQETGLVNLGLLD